ncbi:C2H2-type domain-containing protein [Plasmodiophora brassicae]|uniref:C2H2-type domain-containing protein n=1 Tax=Plasmodiophora brassicae TaxID=37360 RepID=A0A0G4J7N7_PLABS|nr:hypothetical protein PBRA_003036 [Plasmodiophora brassicae]
MTDDRQCPVCNRIVDSGTDLNAHVNSHFPSGSDVVIHEDTCPVCNETIPASQLNDHIHAHLDGDVSGPPHGPLSCSVCGESMPGGTLDEHMRTSHAETPPSVSADEFMSGDLGYMARVSRGIVPRVAESLHREGVAAVLCSRTTALVAGRGQLCGYRNAQMLLSGMFGSPSFHAYIVARLDRIPSVLRLQTLIEEAWAAGFDVDGAEQLQHRLVGTDKWIGTTEVVALLRSLGVRCNCVDVPYPRSARLIFDFVEEHFGGLPDDGTVSVSEVAPLYLQHQGHSQTIIGIARERSGQRSLLLLDPASDRAITRPLRLSATGLDRRQQWQMLQVVGVGWPSTEACERDKTIHPVRLVESDRAQ